MAQDHQQELFSYLNGTYGINDSSPYGQLGFSKYEADQRNAAHSYSSFTSTSPTTSTSNSSTNSWLNTGSASSGTPSYPTAYTSGGSYSSSGTSGSDGFMSLSDWLFDPIEESVSDDVVGGIVIFFAVVGAFLFPVGINEVSWMTVLFGGVIGGIAAPVVYYGLRAAVSLLVLGLIIGFWLAVAAIGFSILAAILN